MKEFVMSLVKGSLVCLVFYIAMTFAENIWEHLEALYYIKLIGSSLIMTGTLIISILLTILKKK